MKTKLIWKIFEFILNTISEVTFGNLPPTVQHLCYLRVTMLRQWSPGTFQSLHCRSECTWQSTTHSASQLNPYPVSEVTYGNLPLTVLPTQPFTTSARDVRERFLLSGVFYLALLHAF